MSNYTETQVAAIVAHGPFTYESAVAFAEANGLKPRSVIAKVKSLGIAYTPKEVKVTKAGAPIVRKDEIVSAICAALGGVNLPSATKMTKADLLALFSAVSAR